MSMKDPVLQLGLGGGQTEQGRPGKGRPFNALVLFLARLFRARLRANAAFTRFFSPGFR